MLEIVTTRLILRPFEKTDEGVFVALKKDLANMAGTTVGPMTGEAAVRQFADYRAQWRDSGIGVFAVEHKDSRSFIGECGFAKRDDLPELTLRYTIDRTWWGRRLAAEAVAAAVEHGFTEAFLDEFSALALATNERSCRILEGVGMHLIQEGFGGTAGFRRYHLTRKQWSAMT